MPKLPRQSIVFILCLLLVGCGGDPATTAPTPAPSSPTNPPPFSSTLLPATVIPASQPTASSEVILYTPVPITSHEFPPLVVAPTTTLPGLPVTATALPAKQLTVQLNPLEQQMFEQLNAARLAAGLLPVSIEPRLQALARSRSADMVARHYFGHVTPDGDSIRPMLSAQGIAYSYAGEIIARGSGADSVSQAVTWWLADQLHRDVILRSEHRFVGVGEASEGDTHTYTVDWIAPGSG